MRESGGGDLPRSNPCVSGASAHEEMWGDVGCGPEDSGVSVVRVAVAAGFDSIRVTGARENNLKDVSVDIPKRRLTVFTGCRGRTVLAYETRACSVSAGIS